MRMNAVLSNPKHPEYGQFTVPLPIPHNQYDGIMEALNAMDMGDPLARDCQMDEILGEYPILKRLEGKPVNIDELDYLAKRLDSFCCALEDAQFQGAAVSYDYSDMADLINLTFSCQEVTVITDFSDLKEIGQEHYMNLNGGSASVEELENLDGVETALLLIDSGVGTVTPYGVVYDNGMRLEQLYNGRQFPEYLYDNSNLGLKIVPAEGQKSELLWLPASEQQIRRTLLRAGVRDADTAEYVIDAFFLQKEVGEILDEKQDSLTALNAMSSAIAKLDEKGQNKLEAVIVFADPKNAAQICQLAKNLDLFSFIPGVHTPEEYGKYMIQEFGRFEYDDNLDGFYDYKGYGEQRIREEGGWFNDYGYVSYHGETPLQDLMEAEAIHQTGLTMGGI